MSKPIYTLWLLLLSGAVSLWGQSPRAFEQAAASAYEVRDYYAALKYYGKVLEMEPARADIMVLYAEAARHYGAYREAEIQYESALNLDQSAGGKYQTALFGLALVKKSLGKYEEALRLFEQYATRPNTDPQLSAQAAGEIAECEWAMEKITNPDRLAMLEPLALNTGESEMGTIRRGDTLYYCTFRPVEWGDRHRPARPLLQVMMAIKGMNPTPVSFNAPARHTTMPAISADGQLMIVPSGDYVSETDIRCDLYFSKKEGGKWSAPVLLPESINVPDASQIQPAIARRPDGYYDLYYVSDAPGGKGGKDLWKVRFSATGVFGKPENLSALNTSNDEATPYFDAAAHTLYFSSTGYQNLGGFDVYKSTWQNNSWSAAKHLPTPVNSSYNDLYYTVHNETVAALTSNRIGAAAAGDEACCYDLFKVTYQPLKLQLNATEAGSNQALTEVTFTLLEASKEPKTRFVTDPSQVQFNISRDRQYAVLASKEGFFPDTIQLSTLDLEPHKTEIKAGISLRPRPIELVVNVYHQFSKEPLSNVSVALYAQDGSRLAQQNTGSTAHEATLQADYRLPGMVVVQKEGFAADTLMVAGALSQPGARVVKNVFLTPVSLQGILPLAIYFDNNVPPRTAGQQVQSYALNYEAYMARRGEFKEQLTKNLATEAEKNAAAERLNAFFEADVKGGFLKLEHFAENLDLFLNNGYEVEIMVKGFASPLASEEYNMALTRRRIVSVKNYLRTVRGGLYESYILSKQLKISTAPFGEKEAGEGVNDSRRQRNLSVFSVEASKERRAEIIEVRLHKIQ